MKQYIFTVGDMTDDLSVQSISDALNALHSVSAQVEYENSKAVVECAEYVGPALLIGVIRGVGFRDITMEVPPASTLAPNDPTV